MKSYITIGTLIDKTWLYYRKHFAQLMSIAGLFLIVALINVIGFILFPTASSILSERAFDASESFGSILLYINSLVITPLVGIWVFNGLVRLIHTQEQGRTTTLKQIMEFARSHFWNSLWVFILFGALIFSTALILIPGIVIVGIGNGLTNPTLGNIGGIFLLASVILSSVLLILWGVRYWLAPYSYIIDGHKGVQAMKHSRQLTKGRFWSVLIRLGIPRLLYLLVFYVLTFLTSMIMSVVVSVVAGLNVDFQVRLDTILVAIVNVVVIILSRPLLATNDYLVYEDLKSNAS